MWSSWWQAFDRLNVYAIHRARSFDKRRMNGNGARGIDKLSPNGGWLCQNADQRLKALIAWADSRTSAGPL